MKIQKKWSLFGGVAMFAMTACDSGVETDVANVELDEQEVSDDLDSVSDEDAPANAWDGLTADEIALLEDENGVDFDPDSPNPADDIAAEVDPSETIAPSCVTLEQWNHDGYRWATSKNGCKKKKRYRMIWRWAPDGPCRTIKPGFQFTEGRTLFGPDPSVKELRKC